jgi:hypothetical protein
VVGSGVQRGAGAIDASALSSETMRRVVRFTADSWAERAACGDGLLASGTNISLWSAVSDGVHRSLTLTAYRRRR